MFLDAALDQLEHGLFFGLGQFRRTVGRRQIVRQAQRMQYQVGGFVERVVVAVAEGQPGAGETARAVADEIDDGGKFGGHVGTLNFVGA